MPRSIGTDATMNWHSLNDPAEELYDLEQDPHQLTNVVDDLQYVKAKSELRERLLAELRATNDPRVLGGGEQFDGFPYRRTIR